MGFGFGESGGLGFRLVRVVVVKADDAVVRAMVEIRCEDGWEWNRWYTANLENVQG